MVPKDQPESALLMVNTFLQGGELPDKPV